MTMPLKSTKYRVKVAQVLPVEAAPTLFAHKRCVLGVSMSNPIFWRSSLGELLEWMGEHFDESMILVGDYLHRLNEQISNGNNETAAIDRAVQMGNDFMAHLSQHLPETGNMLVQRWQPFMEDEDFLREKALMAQLYHEHPSIKASIDSAAALFVWQKQDRAQFKVSKETAIALSAQYLLEEMAVFSVLIDRGWQVVLYPGAQLPLLMEIATGKFKNVPTSLHKGVYVELNVRKKSG